MKMNLAIAIALITAMAYLPTAHALMIQPCGDDAYRVQQAAYVVTGTIKSFDYEAITAGSVRTVIRLFDVKVEKGSPGLEKSLPPGLVFYVAGGVMADGTVQSNSLSPRISKEMIGKTYRVELTADNQLVCGSMGLQAQNEATAPMPPRPTEIPGGDIRPAKESMTLEMQKGWNLFGVPLFDYKGVCPPNSTQPCIMIAVAAPTLDANSCGDLRVYYYDAESRQYKVGKLSDWELGYANQKGVPYSASHGYWLKTSKPCKLTFSGVEKAMVLEGSLMSGWNQIGAPYVKEQAAAALSDCQVTSGPWAFNPAANKWEKAETLKPGTGYFVKVADACALHTDTPPLPSDEKYCTADTQCVRQGSNCDCGLGNYVNEKYYISPPQTDVYCACAMQPSQGVCVDNQCQAAPITVTVSTAPAETVDFATLTSNPEKYDGQRICTAGFYGTSFEFAAMVGNAPKTRCTPTSNGGENCYFQYLQPFIWGSGEFTPTGAKVTGRQMESYQPGIACGLFEYRKNFNGNNGFGHVGAYPFQISGPTSTATASGQLTAVVTK